MTPIQGLQSFDPSTDPLGIGLQQRAATNRQPYPGFGPLPDPQWEGFFQAADEAGVSKFAGGASPVESNQLAGFKAPTDFSGTETYGGNQRGPSFMGTTPHSLTEPSAPVAGLQAAAPYTGASQQAVWNHNSEAGQSELYRRKVAGRG